MLTDAIVKILNEMLEADTGATHALIANRVPCNLTIAEHPTIQVQAQNGRTTVGLLGILNGVAGLQDGKVAAVWDTETDTILRFEARVSE